jgi:hypothetical protein
LIEVGSLLSRLALNHHTAISASRVAGITGVSCCSRPGPVDLEGCIHSCDVTRRDAHVLVWGNYHDVDGFWTTYNYFLWKQNNCCSGCINVVIKVVANKSKLSIL